LIEADAIDWNGEMRRDTAMGIGDLKGWFIESAAIDNPIRREFHLFALLSGCRPAALKEVKPATRAGSCASSCKGVPNHSTKMCST
jgi:hypothetical protein